MIDRLRDAIAGLGFPVRRIEDDGTVETVVVPATVLGGYLIQLRFRVEYLDRFTLRVTGERDT